MTPIGLLDTHCHIGAYSDPVAVLKAAEAAGVSLVAATEGPEEYRRLRTRLGPRPNVEVALGLHPLNASKFSANDLARFFRFLPQATWLGEVGLDFSAAGVGTKRQQQRIFDIVLGEAQPGRHHVTVHSRGAEKEVVAALSQAHLPAILHWYSGPLGPVDEAVSAGLYFSFNIAMVRSKRFPALLKAVPIGHVLLETDGPYARDAGRPAQPSHLREVVIALAGGWNLPLEEAAERVQRNQARFLASDARSQPRLFE